MAPRLGSVCPNAGIAPWARREGPSMAQRGY
ncbi:nucleoid-structuring protein H-NS, partial [Pseudomonas ogarae]